MTKMRLLSLCCPALISLMVATSAVALPVFGGNPPIGLLPHILPIDPHFRWSLRGADFGSGSLDETGGNITAFTGTIDSFSVSLLGGNGQAISPSGAFIYDNILYPTDVSTLDVDGVLVTWNGGEANLWGNGAPDNYSFYTFVNGSYTTSNAGIDTFSIKAPEPGTWAMAIALLGFFGLGFMARSFQRKDRKTA